MTLNPTPVRMSAVLVLVALVLLAACSPAQNQTPPPTVVATTPGVYGMIVGGTDEGPELLLTAATGVDFFQALYTQIYGYIGGGARPDFVPADLTGVLWGLNCSDGLEEAVFVDPELGDAWDGGNLGYFDSVFDNDLNYGVGTVREYSDGTLVLSCSATLVPTGVQVVRHVIVPGAGAEGRFALDAFAVTNTGAAPLDVAPFEYFLNDGADDDLAAPWADYGTIGAFEWATKDSIDLNDPAIGLVPLTSTAFDVDFASTNGDEYTLTGSGTLPVGATTGFAMLAAVRGGFEPNDGPGKDAAMVALGTELDALDGGAFCATTANPLFVWTAVVEGGEAIADAICEGYAALP